MPVNFFHSRFSDALKRREQLDNKRARPVIKGMKTE
jgi:hypothetical protein